MKSAFYGLLEAFFLSVCTTPCEESSNFFIFPGNLWSWIGYAWISVSLFWFQVSSGRSWTRGHPIWTWKVYIFIYIFIYISVNHSVYALDYRNSTDTCSCEVKETTTYPKLMKWKVPDRKKTTIWSGIYEGEWNGRKIEGGMERSVADADFSDIGDETIKSPTGWRSNKISKLKQYYSGVLLFYVGLNT